jgi:hypothetical protein
MNCFVYLIYEFTTSVRDGARVRHGQTTGPGPGLPDFDRPGPARHGTVTVASKGGLGSGESLQVLCVLGTGEG